MCFFTDAMGFFGRMVEQNGRALRAVTLGMPTVHVSNMLQVFTPRYLMMQHGNRWTGPSQGAVRSSTVWKKATSLTTDKTVA